MAWVQSLALELPHTVGMAEKEKNKQPNQKWQKGSSHRGAAEINLTSNHEVAGFDPWPRSVGEGSHVAMSCGVGCRCGSDLIWLWLWYRLAAVAPIGPLAWESPYAAGAALKKKKKKAEDISLKMTYSWKRGT